MDQQARAAFVIAQAACASAKIASMVTANSAAMIANQPMPHSADDFLAVPDQFLIGHNAVIEYLR
ncbi:MAG: hypothetical protein E6Q97_18625 [Desulfurellales bacterium]|nr:MAG: hypothetical protein E6Q97_18625 [Desulfurellales bacterium]